MTALGMGADPAVARRRAIEALRSGVPSRDAVAATGSGQTAIEDRFTALCDAAAAGDPGGMLLGGGFGAGKSHLLEHLAGLALQAGFTVSRVVVSKETPLHDPAKVFAAAAETAAMDGWARPAIVEAAARIDLDGRAFAELLRWTTATGSGLNERFAATLALFAQVRERDQAFADTIVRFWSGDPIAVPELRRRLKEIGEARPSLSPVTVRELGGQRLRFAARLLTAAGSAGWVILFDEVELIGRYSLLQRARSYAEVARWAHGDHGGPGVPIAAVLAMTDDFEAAVISERNDRELIPERLGAKQTPEAAALAAAATRGIRVIDREMQLLTPPDAAELAQAYARLKQLHGDAFGWVPPDVAGLERLGATRMRQYVRTWINEWDLVRLDPSYRPETEVLDVSSDYREDPDLEREAVTPGSA
jgi:BREX system ATP-binding protein BrxC/D